MGKLYSIWNVVRRYKYVAAILIFLLIIGVVDENSWMERHHRRSEIARLEAQIGRYQQQYDEHTRTLEALMSDPRAVEKMAREKYYMKRPDEDVFVFVGTDNYEVQKPLEKPADSRLTLPGETVAPDATDHPDAAAAQQATPSATPQQ